MSLQADGSYACDRCGADIGNAGVTQAVTIVDLDPARPGAVRKLNLCLDRTGADGEAIRGCRGQVLTRAALRHYVERTTTA